jgi:hypothetical protein
MKSAQAANLFLMLTPPRSAVCDKSSGFGTK